jgi:uncharacterized protein YoaH (UPF0181 family)
MDLSEPNGALDAYLHRQADNEVERLQTLVARLQGSMLNAAVMLEKNPTQFTASFVAKRLREDAVDDSNTVDLDEEEE